MKKLALLACMVVGLTTAMAQKSFEYSEGVPALVYALPATELVFDLEIEKITEKPGIFYQYSQRYLATTKVVTDESTTHRVRSVRMTTRPVVDPSRRFTVAPGVVSGLVLNRQGLLAGVNVVPAEKRVVRERMIRKEEPQAARQEGLLPLNQEYMMAGSTAKMAEGAAFQIYAIRESRLSLLSGELEHLPADGSSLKMMLGGLDRQERELTELFTGSVRKEIIRRQITIVPDSANYESVLFRLSAQRGLVANDDLGGEPYYLVIDADAIPTPRPGNSRSSKKGDRLDEADIALYTVLPAQASIEVSDGVNSLLKQNTDISQFGVLIPYEVSLFKSKDLQMEVDPATGRLQRIHFGTGKK
jgi:hypothetical protein